MHGCCDNHCSPCGDSCHDHHHCGGHSCDGHCRDGCRQECVETSDVRYNGPSLLEVGIMNGDNLNIVIEKLLAAYMNVKSLVTTPKRQIFEGILNCKLNYPVSEILVVWNCGVVIPEDGYRLVSNTIVFDTEKYPSLSNNDETGVVYTTSWTGEADDCDTAERLNRGW